MNVLCIFAIRKPVGIPSIAEGKPDTLVAIVEQPAGVSDQQVLLGWLRINGYMDEAARHYRTSSGPVIPWTPTMAEHPPLF